VVAGIGRNTVADCKILACNAMGESIAFALEIDIEQIADVFLDGIMRRYVEPVCRANRMAMVDLPVPGRPEKI